LGLSILRIKKAISDEALLTLLLMLLSMMAATFGTGFASWYYCIPFVCFAGIGEIGIAVFAGEIRSRMINRPKKQLNSFLMLTVKFVIASALSVIIILNNGFWQLSVLYTYEKSGVENTCDAILTTWAQGSHTGKPTILVYHSRENGYYSELGTSPEFRYFYAPGINFSLVPGFLAAQDSYILDGLPDYVICVSNMHNYDFGITKLNDHYIQIGTFDKYVKKPYDDNGMSYIFLYQKL